MASNRRSEPDLWDALDFPAELQPLQDAYWRARREWEYLSAAFTTVLNYELSKREGQIEVAPGVWGTPPDE